MSNREIVVDSLSKQYSEKVLAVDNISLRVESGQIYGFLGPNGAGKSTTIKILTSLALPTSGSATVGGYDVVSEADQVRRIMGVALQDIGLDSLMKSMELLTLQGQLFGAKRSEAEARAKELVELVGLTDAVDRRVGTYSGGMRRRLDLALALVHRHPVLGRSRRVGRYRGHHQRWPDLKDRIAGVSQGWCWKRVDQYLL
jgi:ABC-2 type transport system ATP-binding protein